MSWLPLLKKLAPALALLVALGAAFAGGWLVNGWRIGEGIAQYRQELAESAAQKIKAAQARTLERQAEVEALDARYTEELSNAQAEIDRLSDDVAAGRRRLRLQAECPGVPSAPGSAGVDDAGGPRLTDAAERDYWRLRERIGTVTQQLTALQEYVRTQCRATR
tara:strand:+ start:594 stop:1085 length:492 start_codon:yes stop_codon:yes gene_type:complete